MLMFSDFVILFSCYVLVQCEIPNLNVRKLDRQLIAKKRQDTLDLCRIFTEENAKIQNTKPKIIPSYKNAYRSQDRHKRETGEISGYKTMATTENLFLKPETKSRHKRENILQSNIPNASDKFKQEEKQGGDKYAVNPALSPEDAKKIESIVKTMYDEMEEHGEKIPYRQNPDVTDAIITTTQEPKNTSEKSPSRRLFFAPKLLIPGKPESKTRQPNLTSVYEKARWRHGIVPYFIDSKTYDAQLQEIIMNAFDYIEKATCIRLQKLRERPTDKKSLQEVDWVYISNPAGVRQCVHSNEKRKIDGVQMSVLGYDCMSLGDVVHEVMHILGFSHEHTRSDRDQHISILWDNIKPGYKKYFEIAKPGDQYTLENLPYDYASILHYPPRAFSKNGQITIITEAGIQIGQREGLSEIDLEKVGFIYAGECVERNKDYLLKTCPSVVKSEQQAKEVSQKDIDDYFKERLWPFGIVNYKMRDKMEFSTEEKENIKAVIDHIEKETCIQFRDISVNADDQLDKQEVHQDHEDHEENDLPSYNKIIEDDFDPDDPSKQPPVIITTDQDHDQDEPKTELLQNAVENEISHSDDQEVQALNGAIPSEGTPNDATSNIAILYEGTSNKKRIRRQATPLAQRRHANSIMVLARSAMPGCKCPKSGKPDGNTVLEINADCFNSVNDLLHLFVHILGLDHQHNMHDRDNYLHIMWNNLTTEIREELKEKLPPAASAGFPYDYQSVMHYPWLLIKNGISNMMYPIWNDGWAMGHWTGLSSFDVQKLNLLYFSQCSERQKQTQK